MKKRILSLLLALTMLVSMLPVQALAEDAPEAPTAPETTAATEAPTIPETTAATEAPTVPETTAETEAPVESTVEATESVMTVMSDEANTCGENLAWKVENGTLTIYATAEAFGQIEDYAKGGAPWYDQRASITTVDMQAGYWFGSGAFYGLSNVTLVKLPKCLVSFEDAFEGCTSLASFCFPQGSDAGFAVDFYWPGDDGLSYGSEIVDESASDGFRRLCALAPAAEPNSNYTAWFQYINTGALRGCKVTDLTFRMDVTVDYNAFINCDSLETVTVYKSATFADSVFVGCSKLESITFVADAPRLSANAFNGLDGVTIHYYSGADGWEDVAGQNYGGRNITWNAVEPATDGTCGDNLSWSFDADTGVLSIDAVDPAQSCGGITAYDYGDAPWYRYRDQITSIDMNAGLYIGGYTIFADLENVTHVDLPEDLEELSNDDFAPLYNLTSIAFPEGNANGFSVVDETSVIKTEGDKVTLIITAIGAACTIPDSVTTIGSYALSWRYIGDTLVIPATVTELEDYALYQCTVTTIRFTGHAPIIGDNAFGNVSANVIYPANDETWDNVIANMYGGTLFWVKEGETPTSGVCGFNLLWDFDAEAGILTISANDPNEVAYMDDYAEGNAPWYAHRENITEVDLNSCRNIGENAFYGLSELTTFWLSGDLEEIGAGAFAGCTQLTSFWGESTVYYGAGATILQKTASFGPLVVVVSPGAGETLYLPYLTSAILPGALMGCDSIQKITFPDTFRHLQEGALDGCNSDLTLTFLGEPPYIEKLAFAGFNITVDCPIDGGWQDVALAGNYGANSITWPEDLFSTIGEDHNYCGEDLAWKIDEDGTLIIYPVLGTGGNMDNYGTASGESTVSSYALARSGESGQAPWYDQRESITAIDMQGGITIGAHAFDGLSRVTTVNLPKSLIYFTGSFGECTSLETFGFPNGNDYGYSVVDGGKAIVRDDQDLINLYAVVPTVSGEYTVPGDVQAIHYGAFAGCTGIDKVTFPEGLVLVCGDALTGCGDGTEFVFTGDAPEMEENAFDGLTDVTVTYPGDADGWEEIVDNFGEDIAFENTYAVELDESNPTTLLAGKSATLKASLSPSNLTKTSIVWSLKNGDDSEFATLSASGKLTAKAAITEKHEIVVVAASKDGKATPAEYTVTLIPKASSVSVFVNDADATNGECYIDLNDDSRPVSYTFRADIAPDDAGQAVTWKVSDTKGTYVTYEEVENADETTELVVTPAETGKTGTVTVTATAADGSNKSAKVTLRIAKLAQAVNITNAPTDMCGGGKIVLTTDVAANKELTDKTVLWSLSDDSIPYAAISANGTLTTYPVPVPTTIAVTATVKANPEVSDTVEITLHPAVDSVTITPIDAQMEELDDWDITNGTIDFDAVCFPEGAMTDGEWSVSSTKIATIDKETGVLTPLNAGKVKVTFKTTDGSKKQATVQVTIVKPVRAVTVEAVNLPESGILYSGQTLSLKATTWSDEACTIPATNQKVYWDVLERYTDENGSTWEWLSSAATISSSGKLTVKAVANNVQVYAVAASEENWVLGEIPLTIQPKQENTLAITIGGSTLDENGEVFSTWFRPLENQEWMQPGESYEIGGAWFNRTSEEYTSILEGCTITSSNAKVASINNGVLSIVAPGTTTLTAECLGEDGKTQTATAVLTVRYYVDHVTIAEPTTQELRSGQSLSLKASVWADEDGTIEATNQKVWWEVYEVVTDPETGGEELIYGSDAATISSSGKLTAKNVTEDVTVRIYASSQDDYWLDDYVDITIRPKQEYQTSIYQNGMQCSGTVNIPVNLLDDGVLPASELSVQTYVSVPGSEYDGTYVSGEEYNAQWSSSKPKVADFDESGNLVFTGTLGSTTITAAGTIDGQTVTAKVTLKAVKAVTSVDVQQKVAGQKLYSGKSINLTATVNPDATNKKVTWVSSDPSIATVSASGQVKAGKVYEQTQVTIYAVAQDGFGVFGEIELTIYPMATTVSIMNGGRVMNNRAETISVGDTAELTAVVYPGDAAQDVKWTPASNSVVDVNVGEDGVVTITAKKKGTVTIKAAAQDGSGKSASFKLTVNP